MVATGLAVLFAVAFISGTFAFTDTARHGYYDTYARVAKGIDVSVRPAGSRPLTPAQLAAVRGVPGVVAADGRMQAPLGLVGRDGQVLTNFGDAGVVVSTDSPPGLRSFDLSGDLPGAGQVAVDVDTAAHQHWRIGDQVSVVAAAGRVSARISGLLDFGVSRQYAGISVVGLPAARITALTGYAGFQEIVATGADPAALAGRVRAAVGAGPLVVTGDQRRRQLADSATSVAGQFQYILLIFGAVSLIVAAFVIYNTFAILLTQRVRETALLRCVGATRRQVFGLALAEAASIGLAASALGVVAGALAGYCLIGLVNRFADAAIPTSGVSLSPRTAVIGLAVGLVVTVAAALLPAVRATRVTAMGALRDQPLAGPGRRAPRVVLGGLLAGLGVAVTVAGVANADPQLGTLAVVAGGLLAFGGLLVWAPLFIGPLTAAVGALPVLLTGTPGRLAVANARRNPGRTAVTSATLMIGIGLMALFSVALGSVRETADQQISARFPVDYVMTPVHLGTSGAVPPAYAAALRGLPQLAAVGEIRIAAGTLGGARREVAAIDPAALGGIARPRLSSGRLADLAAGTVLLSAAHPAPLGSAVTLRVGGHSARLRVVGTGSLNIPVHGDVDALVSWDQFAALAGPGGDAAVLAKAAPGVTPVASRDALGSLAGRYPLVTVNSVADIRSGLDGTVRQLLALFGGLLGTSVLISLFGIANTMALSVRERTRESAIVRALGLTRAQLRATLLLEALLMGLVGALVGIAFGLVYGRLVVTTVFATIGPVIVVPWAWIAGLALLAGAAATTAAVLPARHAARTSIVTAMAAT
jgi:putative ABC transport system permease protein